LISLITVLVSSSFGCIALCDVGLLPTLLPLLKDLDPQHIHLVTTIVHVREPFMYYRNPDETSFRDIGGLHNIIACLKLEFCNFEEKGSRVENHIQVPTEILLRRMLLGQRQCKFLNPTQLFLIIEDLL